MECQRLFITRSDRAANMMARVMDVDKFNADVTVSEVFNSLGMRGAGAVIVESVIDVRIHAAIRGAMMHRTPGKPLEVIGPDQISAELHAAIARNDFDDSDCFI